MWSKKVSFVRKFVGPEKGHLCFSVNMFKVNKIIPSKENLLFLKRAVGF